nr:MAG TPA: N BRO family, N-terminal domain [Caudoviricetes sp.]
MNSLFPQPNTQVEILNFQTFVTEYVSKRYGVSKQTIIDHKRNHADEIIDGVHFVYELVDTNGGKQEVLKWTLRGIIKLGMFIRSKEAKYFRLWAEQELEKTILGELALAKETRQKNLSLVSKVADLNAVLIDNAKRHKREINGYKSQLKQHNDKIVVLKHELEKASNPRPSDPIYAQIKAERDYYKERYKKLSQSKDETIILNLAKIQKELEKSYTAIGAVMAYADGDDYFIKKG